MAESLFRINDKESGKWLDLVLVGENLEIQGNMTGKEALQHVKKYAYTMQRTQDNTTKCLRSINEALKGE